jgi:hypothetical protein
MTLLREMIDQISRDLAHLLRQQCSPVHFSDAQCAMHRVQVLIALAEQSEILLLLAKRFERGTSIVELTRELASDDVQSL